MSLVPFLMSFLASREKLPISTVTSAGATNNLILPAALTPFDPLCSCAAQCLYVLTDDNPFAIDELRTNAAYTACLLSLIDTNPQPNEKGKDIADDRVTTLRVLCCGKSIPETLNYHTIPTILACRHHAKHLSNTAAFYRRHSGRGSRIGAPCFDTSVVFGLAAGSITKSSGTRCTGGKLFPPTHEKLISN